MNTNEIVELLATNKVIYDNRILSLYVKDYVEVSSEYFSFGIEVTNDLEKHIRTNFKNHNISISKYESEGHDVINYFISSESCQILINYHIAKGNNFINIHYCYSSKDMANFENFRTDLKNLKKKTDNDSGKENFNFLLNGRNGMYINSVMGKCASQPLIIENYNDDVIEQYNDVVRAWENPDGKSGRLVVLTGKPGSGKTYMIRSFQKELKNCELISIPSNCANLLSDPSLLEVLSDFDNDEDKSIVFVIEDADSLLQKRDGYNNDLVSTILNLTDGIFASAFDIKMILTTNTKIVDFDDALIRNGRLFKHIEINELNESKAREFLNKHDCANIKPESYILADLYSLVDNSKNNVPKKKDKKFGF